MITKEYGKFFGVCDCCEDVTPIFDNWSEVRKYMQDNRWKTYKNRTTEEWENLCPRCRALEDFNNFKFKEI